MDARRTLIADATLALIADRGIRAMSHLAVDAQAGIAKGSTSYYCRKRVDLLRLTMERLYELDRTDIAALTARLAAGSHDRTTVNREVATLIVGWLTPPVRGRTIARFELFLATAHEPELHALLEQQVGEIRSLVGAVAAATDPPGQPERSVAALMLAEGLMLSVIRQDLPAPRLADVERLMATLDPPRAG